MNSPKKKSAKARAAAPTTDSNRNTRDSILDAALLEFSAVGFKGASLRAIGKRAGVDFTLITYYFGNKTQLWQAVVTRGIEIHRATMQTLAEKDDNHSPGQALRNRMHAEFVFACSEDSLFHIVTSELQAQEGERLQWIKQHFLQKSKAAITALIRQAQDSGEIVQGDPQLLYQILQTGVRAILFLEKTPFPFAGEKNSKLKQRYWALVDQIFFHNVATVPDIP